MALEDLVSRTRAALEQRIRQQDLSRFRRRAHATNRSLRRALAGEHTGYILQCERPAPGETLTRTDFDPAALARTYAPFADAIAVSTHAAVAPQALAEPRNATIDAVRSEVDVPLLCTDLIVDPRQVDEVRYFGADAVTLLLAALDDDTLDACVSAADRLNMDVVLVVRTPAELERALDRPNRIVGLDHRAADQGGPTVPVDPQLATRIPADRLTVALGELVDHHQALDQRPRVDAFLTGRSLVERDDVPRALRELIFGRIKVCGLTEPGYAEAAWQAGATMGGLIFAPGSARQVAYARARALRMAAPLQFVGIFVDDPIDDVCCCAQRLSLRAVQLHGHETNDYLLELRRRLPPRIEIWKAMAVRDRLPNISAVHADRIVLDNFGRRCASSEVFDWSVLETLDQDERDRVILSGGLTADNAARADAFGTWGLDVNLGVETSAGLKSRVLLERFFAALRGKRRQP